MGTTLLTVSQTATTSLLAWIASLQRSLDSSMIHAEGVGPQPSQGSGSNILIIIAVIAGIILCVIPLCIFLVLLLLGPAIGNVFSNITDNI